MNNTVNNTVNNTTNNMPEPGAITVTPTMLNVSEDGTTATFTIVLDVEPEGDVTIALASSDETEATVSPASLTFTAANWNTAQTVTVTGVDDAEFDGSQPVTITTTVTGTGNYAMTDAADVTVNVADNDTASGTVAPQAITVVENGAAGTFTVVLGAMPSGTVTIPVTVGDANEITADVTELTFDDTNYNTPQTVTVTAIDDSEVEPPLTTTVALGAATGGGYDGLDLPDVTVTVVDDDQATVAVTPTLLTTSETGTTATFDVTLSSAPTDTVTITATSTDPSEGTVSGPITLDANTLTGTFTVTGVDDFDADGTQTYQVTLAAASNDGAYDGISIPSVAVSNTDDDNPSVIVTPTNISVSENGATSSSFTVALGSDPGETVTVTLALSDATEASLSTTTLTFTSGDFSTPQTVTVTAIDDADVEGNQNVQVITTMNATQAYAGAPVDDVNVLILDDDAAGITVTPTTGLVTTEAGGTDTFTVVLNAAPSANVTIDLTSSNTAEGTVSPASLTFTPANWNTAQTVTVTGVDDAVDDGVQIYSIITAPAVSADTAFNGLNAPDVVVQNTDDDVAGFLVTPGDTATNPLVVSEDGTTATFEVSLLTPPTADVIIPMQSTDTTEGTIAPQSLTFDATNWQTPQTVTITGVNDAIADGPVQWIAVLDSTTSADPAYNNLDPSNITVITNDNEAGFSVTPDTLTISESGANATATVGVRLNSPPAQNVLIAVNGDGDEGDEYNVAPQSLVFTPANWNTVQNLTVTGVADMDIDGSQTWSFDVFVDTTLDPDFAALGPITVDGTTTDSDSPGVNVFDPSFAVSEGDCETVDVVLNTDAVSNVTFQVSLADTMTITNNQLRLGNVSGCGATSMGGAVRTCTIAAGATTASFEVCGFDDIISESQKSEAVTIGTLTAAGGMTDPYNGLDPQDLSVTINDDDAPALVVETEVQLDGNTQLVTTEGDALAILTDDYRTFTVSLATAPTQSVVVTLTSSDPGEATLSDVGSGVAGTGSIALVFQPSDWSTPQTVYAIGQDDALGDGTQPFEVSFTTQSSDSFYNALTTPSLAGLNVDNDAPGWTVTNLTTTRNTDEAGTTAAWWLVWRNTQPASNISVNLALTPDDEAEFFCSPCTSGAFGDTNTALYDTTPAGPDYVLFVATGLDDAIVDGPVTFSVAPTGLTTTDPAYVGTTYPTVQGINQDNDSVGLVITGLASDLDEDDSDSFQVRLASQPSANVTINVATSDAGEATITSGASLTFTTANWNSNQSVTVAGVEDNTIDGDQDIFVTFAGNSTDMAYNGLSQQEPVTIHDIDLGDLEIDTQGAIVTNESGTQHIIRARLTSQPTADVVVPVYSFDTTEATVSPASLTFTTANWNTYQNVTITGVDDVLDDGNQSFDIWFDITTSADPAYNGLGPFIRTGTNNDDDQVGVTVLHPSNPSFLVTDEDGGADTFQVVLNTAPQAGETVTLVLGLSGGACAVGARCVVAWPAGTAASGLGNISPSTLTFTDANWSTPQTVTVTGDNNGTVAPQSWYRVPIAVDTTVVGRDTDFDSVFVEQVLGVLIDNDNEAVILLSSPEGRASSATAPAINQRVVTGENGAAGTVWVRTTELPTANVTLDFEIRTANGAAASTEATTQAQFTITSSNYRELNAITVTGADDGAVADAGGFTGFRFQTTATSADPDYNGANPFPTGAPSFLQGYNVDNDECRLLLFPQTTTAANSRLDGQFTPTVPVPFLALVAANPPTTAVQTAVTYTGAVQPLNAALTFSGGAAPQVLHAYGTAADANFTVNFAVTLGDACYTNAAPVDLYGFSND